MKDLEAKWCYIKKGVLFSGTGIGIAKSIVENSFLGKYNIVYFDNEGMETSNYELLIEVFNGFYHLKWLNNNEVVFIGIGIEYNNMLFAGWTKYQE